MSVDQLADILMGLSIALAVGTIVAMLRSMQMHQDHSRWLRAWVILVCVYVIGSRAVIILGIYPAFAVGVVRSEGIVISLLAVVAAYGLWEW
jgi:hypothetical protein